MSTLNHIIKSQQFHKAAKEYLINAQLGSSPGGATCFSL